MSEDPKNISQTTQQDSEKLIPIADTNISTETRQPRTSIRSLLPVVGIGSSAGGLEALEEFFRHMPPESGMAFVVVSHQSPGHTSLLPELLGKCTAMRTALAEHGVKLEPNCIYINPPGHDLSISRGKLVLAEVQQRRHLPIDFFFRSLALDKKELAICVILSGTATDGTVGLRDVKAESGLVVVQDPSTAKYQGMPLSAIGTRLVDYVLPPENMAAALIAYLEIADRTPFNQLGLTDLIKPEVLEKILTLLCNRTGHNFTSYKRNMVERRVLRRMVVTREATPEGYLRFLDTSAHEVSLLMKELLISVTNFFRDPEAFDILARFALPQLLISRPEGRNLRAWCPGCATGEEVYSLSILLSEVMEKLDRPIDLQLFGTDLDRDAIDVGRRGSYPAGITLDVSAQRLEKFFLAENDGYRVGKDIRERIIFAVQDLIKDPPFTKLDVIVCRNVLIYMDTALQKRVLSMFHFALNPGGLLFLGSAEATSGCEELFEVVDKKWRIFSRKDGLSTYALPAYLTTAVNRDQRSTRFPRGFESNPKPDISVVAEKLLANKYAPASAIVNQRGDMFYLHGKAGTFLEPASGKQPSSNIVDMAREGLSLSLASVLRRAALEKTEIVQENVRVRTNGDFARVTLVARILDSPDFLRGLILVTFMLAENDTSKAAIDSPNPQDAQSPVPMDVLLNLELELKLTRESLHCGIEQLQTSNEELQSANEELQSSNEELETSREELQSLNEELHTVNTELESKVEQLSSARDDMQNLLDSISVGTIFLDSTLKIRRFTKPATSLIRMIDSDIGRPISDLSSNLNHVNIISDSEEVLRTLVVHEKEVQAKDGSWCLVRIAPYRTSEKAIEGLVITFVDITKLKRVEKAAKV